MKRSEMLGLAWDAIMARYIFDDTAMNKIKICLDVFEKHGMLPPPKPESMNLDANGDPQLPIECWEFEWEDE